MNKIGYNITNQIITLLVIELVFWGIFFLGWVLLRDLLPGFRFQNPEFLWFLLIIPVMIFIYMINLAVKNRAINRFSDEKLVGNLIPDFAPGKIFIRFILYHIAIAFFMIGIANPQMGSKIAEEQAIGQYEQTMQQQLLEKQQTLLQPILDQVNEAIKQVAKDNGYTMIFDSAVLLYADEAQDVGTLVKAKLGI